MFPVRLNYLLTLFALLLGGALSAADLLPPGHRPVPAGVHALVGGKVIVKPGTVLDAGTIVIRDGRIAVVGANVPVPADARVWDMKGLTIYAGFIDAYLTLGANAAPVAADDGDARFEAMSGVNFFGVPGQEKDPGNPGPGYELSKLTPEHRAAASYVPNAKTLESLRDLGFTAGNLTPTRGILRGTSAFIVLADVNPNVAILRPDTFQHVALDTAGGGGENSTPRYPGSLMGVIAAVRQGFFDAQHYALDLADFQQRPTQRPRPNFNPALEALAPAIGQRQTVVFEPGSALMVDRAARVAREVGVKFALVASGQEWRRPELAKASAAPFIVPVNFPAAPKMPQEDDWLAVSLDQLRAWDWAADNPALLRAQGRDIALTTHGLADRKLFRKNLRLSLDRGLAENDALAALTIVPAQLCGVDSQLGTIEAGKIANLTVIEGGGYFEPDAKVREVWIDGRVHPSSSAGPRFAEKPKTPPNADNGKADAAKDEKAKAKKAELRDLQKQRLAHAPTAGRGPLAAPSAVLVRGATVWTSAAAGRIAGADVLFVGGQVRAIGRGLSVPTEFAEKTVIIDAAGQHLTPGLVDCHSHAMILGAVNEGTIPSSAMVRVGDVVNSETPNLHLELAGGLTTANLLHGSANPIGGQNQVIKLKDGAPPEELKFAAAPPGIKFALGENVKQSNWGERNVTRFPQTRMGVPAFMANRFTAAQQYVKVWEDYRAATNAGGQVSRLSPPAKKPETDATPVPPRRDLEMEAIGEILAGQRLIHCHSYRGDEILAFLRTMESFGVRVATLQHVLEGYKVADEIAKHGAGGSCFADWWAYKFEVYDAIPYAGSLMRDRGVTVSFNSDSSDLARRLYLEAAKAVKYGGTSEEDALKFVTSNPAKQLRIDARVGSLEVGKDADFALWSKSPLDSTTVCLQTWIEGKKYFDRALVPARTAALEKERADLLTKVKKVASLSGGGGGGDAGEAARMLFFQRALEQRHSLTLDCQDCKATGRNQ